MKPLRLHILACFLSCCLQAGPGADAGWRAGLAVVKITPEKPVMLQGFGNRIQPFERVAQDIHAKALVLEDNRGRRAVIVTTDLCGLPAWFAEPLASRISDRTGFGREQILLSWSHNHAGPSLSSSIAPRPGVSLETAENQVAYTHWLQDRLLELVVDANGRLEPARLSYGQGVASFVINRREFTPNGVILGVNPKGLVDRSVPVLRVDSADGNPRAVLFGAACHNVSMGSKSLDLCGDYAGFAQSFVEDKHPGVQAMFMMGCGGDANPYPRLREPVIQPEERVKHTRALGTELGGEVARVLEGRLRVISGPLQLAYGMVDLELQLPARKDLEALAKKSPNWIIGSARKMLGMVERGEKLPTHYSAPVAVWQFGSDLTLVALSGEVVVDYVTLIEKEIGPLNLWVAAYCNDHFGYLPSSRVIAEGGYETRGLRSGDGWFAPAVQDAVVGKVKELSRVVGRPASSLSLTPHAQ